MLYRHRVVREGVIAGVIGATAVVVWFLILNGLTGRPLLFTPLVLGRALFGVLGPIGSENPLVHAAAYTAFHYAAFILLGVLLSLFVHRAEEQPSVLALFLIIFVVFEMAFYGLTAILSDNAVLGSIAWWEIGAANLLAALLMGAYMWRLHPALGSEFAHALGDYRE
ncbi:MAG TPA: hypothetical protein VFS05_11780 [Gemmatimonadaceae bacterium]|nr:hypothetical protein [Gemmatimonadaceae bacterium]